MAANPTDTPRLRLDEEVRTIQSRLREGEGRESIDFSSHWAARASDLSRLLLEEQPDVVHFAGHGERDGIVLQDDSGTSRLVEAGKLAEMFRLAGESVQVVVLNACYSEAQADAIAAHVPAVVGTNNEITDEGAIRFAAGFYRGVAHGVSVRGAFDLGINEVDLSDLPDSATPQLLLRDDDSDVSLRGPRSLKPVLLVVVALAVLAGAFWLITVQGNDMDEAALQNYALVVDGSMAMAEPLENRPRFDYAVEEVAAFTGPLAHTGLSLRIAGGACQTSVSPVVRLGTDNAERVSQAIAQATPGGEAPLVAAVRSAIDDFADPATVPAQASPSDVSRHVLVITSTSDTCAGDEELLADYANDASVELEFTFIGFGLDRVGEDELRSLARRVGGTSLLASTPEELQSLLDGLLFDGFAEATTAMFDAADRSSLMLNAVRGALLARSFRVELGEVVTQDDIADDLRQIDDLVALLDNSEALHLSLRNELAPPEYGVLWGLTNELRAAVRRDSDALRVLFGDVRDGTIVDQPGTETAERWDGFEQSKDERTDLRAQFFDLESAFLDAMLIP